MSLVITVIRKAIMRPLIPNLKRLKTSLGLGNLLVNDCGQHRGPNATQTYSLHQLPGFVSERPCNPRVSLN